MSTTTTSKYAFTKLPLESVAVASTGVIPTGKIAPSTLLYVISTSPELSVAVTPNAPKVISAPQTPASVFILISATVKTGSVISLTVTEIGSVVVELFAVILNVYVVPKTAAASKVRTPSVSIKTPVPVTLQVTVSSAETEPKAVRPSSIVETTSVVVIVGGPLLITATVYVLVEASCAVTIVVIVFEPTLSAIEPDAAPEDTVCPFTLIVAFASAFVGVTVILVVPLATLAV